MRKSARAWVAVASLQLIPRTSNGRTSKRGFGDRIWGVPMVRGQRRQPPPAGGLLGLTQQTGGKPISRAKNADSFIRSGIGAGPQLPSETHGQAEEHEDAREEDQQSTVHAESREPRTLRGHVRLLPRAERAPLPPAPALQARTSGRAALHHRPPIERAVVQGPFAGLRDALQRAHSS